MIRIISIILGLVNVIIGLCLLAFLIFLQGISPLPILGIFYFIFGMGVIIKKGFKIGILLFGIVPLTILSGAMILTMGGRHVPEYYQTPLGVKFILIALLLLFCTLNLVFFSLDKAKKLFFQPMKRNE